MRTRVATNRTDLMGCTYAGAWVQWARWNRPVMHGTVGRAWMVGTWRQRVMFSANLNGRVTHWVTHPAR